MAMHGTPFSRLVTRVGPNDDFGLKVTEHAREHDDVFKSAIVALMDGASLERMAPSPQRCRVGHRRT
jgi:hypothetical protein